MAKKTARIVYLAATQRVPLPSIVIKYLPQGDMISTITKQGIQGAGVEFGIKTDQLQAMFHEGSKGGVGTDKEFRVLCGEAAIDELEMVREDMPFSDYTKAMGALTEFVNSHGVALVTQQESSLGDDDPGEDIVKYDSGFEPFDMITGGFYQGLITMLGKPGSGKTSFMLAMMSELRRNDLVDECWFYETEISLPLMKYKLRGIRQGMRFKEEDRLICGLITMPEIMERVQKEPNLRRAIFIDGPDVMSGDAGEGKRYALEKIYRDLVKLKEMSAMVVVSSQAKRNDGKQMTQDSVAEAYTKAWYSDMMIAINRGKRKNEGFSDVTATVVKNRFGIPDQSLNFDFDYVHLIARVSDEVRQGLADEDESGDW